MEKLEVFKICRYLLYENNMYKQNMAVTENKIHCHNKYLNMDCLDLSSIINGSQLANMKKYIPYMSLP